VWDIRETYTAFKSEYGGKIDLRELRNRWEDNCKIDLKQQGLRTVDGGSTENLVIAYKRTRLDIIKDLNLYLRLLLSN
jgi:hypothetical protein